VHYFTIITDTLQHGLLTLDYTSRPCCYVLTSWLWQISSSVSSSEENRCRHNVPVQHVRVRTTVIKLIMLAATVVVHCTLIKNWSAV